MTDDFADREGLEMGDEYFANLDHIESVENFKEGYESEAHCSDSEGSGVDVSRIKIQPSALVSAHPGGRPTKKSESKSKGERTRWSQRGRVKTVAVSSCYCNPRPRVLYLFMYFVQPKTQARQGKATKTMTRIQRAKSKVTAPMTRL